MKLEGVARWLPGHGEGLGQIDERQEPDTRLNEWPGGPSMVYLFSEEDEDGVEGDGGGGLG